MEREIVCAILAIGPDSSDFLDVHLFAPDVAKAQAPEQLKVKITSATLPTFSARAARDQINALAAEVDKKADAQIAVVTIKTLDGRPIEEYSIDLATRLGIGPKQSSRGVLILLAVNDHQYRTEVGYGLEGILPDGKVGASDARPCRICGRTITTQRCN